MTDKNEKLTTAKPKLSLGRGSVEQGVVRQSFSHGRTKAVVVEKVKRRVGPGEAKPAEAAAPAPTARRAAPAKGAPAKAAPAPAPAPTPAPAPGAAKPRGVVLRTLTEEEQSARAHALTDFR